MNMTTKPHKPRMTDLDLAQVFEDAIERLYDPARDSRLNHTDRCCFYSCDAIRYELEHRLGTDDFGYQVRDCLEAVIDTAAGTCISGTTSAYDDLDIDQERQQARALWLTLLAELAESGDLRKLVGARCLNELYSAASVIADQGAEN